MRLLGTNPTVLLSMWELDIHFQERCQMCLRLMSFCDFTVPFIHAGTIFDLFCLRLPLKILYSMQHRAVVKFLISYHSSATSFFSPGCLVNDF